MTNSNFNVCSFFKFSLLAATFSLVLAACGNNGGIPGTGNGKGPAAPVGFSEASRDFASAAAYGVLAKTAITTTAGSQVNGHMGISPAAASYITGFGLVAGTGYSSSSLVIGNHYVYAADYAAPTPSNLTTAIGTMETAYTDAAGRSSPNFSELATGELGGLTLVPGLYKWTNNVTISTDTTISGGPSDVWIFQISGNVTMAVAKQIILTGGAETKNIFWQVAGAVTVGASSIFKGIILGKTAIIFGDSSVLNGRALAQTAVTLDNTRIIEP